MALATTKLMFPCPVCKVRLDVRETKQRKPKPYVVCDSCGIQMFVRYPAGIRIFTRLVVQGTSKGTMDALEEMEQRYRKRCPDCGFRFWVESALIHTSWINGEFEGYRCPQEGCKGIVKEETEK